MAAHPEPGLRMINEPQGLAGWTQFLGAVELPVLKQTARQLALLAADDPKRCNARSVGQVVGHDPMMTVKLLRLFESRRSRRSHFEVCRIEQMLVMIGVETFLQDVPPRPLVQDVLHGQNEALSCVLHAVLRAQRAAHYAADWAAMLHDLHFDEIRIAAMLHELAELLLWCFAPARMLAIRQAQRQDRTLRSRDAQIAAFGFTVTDLQLALARQWELPELLLELMDDACSGNVRVRNVTLAIALARHSANGWDDAALPDDYRDIGGLLRIAPEQVMHMVGSKGTYVADLSLPLPPLAPPAPAADS
jgi:HD-like signal output (HDOD) protein